MSLFSASLRLVGLSQAEASAWLSQELGRNVGINTVKNLSLGRSKVGQPIWAALQDLYQAQVRASEEALEIHNDSSATQVDLSAYGRAAEWPSVRVFENVCAMVALGAGLDVIDE